MRIRFLSLLLPFLRRKFAGEESGTRRGSVPLVGRSTGRVNEKMNEKRHGPRLKARSQLLTRATRMPSVHRVRFTPARILLSALSASHSAQLHPADTPSFVFVSPASPRISPRRPLPPLTHYHRRFDSPPLFSSLLALLLLPLFQFFFYPCISFFFFFSFILSFLSKRKKERKLSLFHLVYSLSRTIYIYIYRTF